MRREFHEQVGKCITEWAWIEGELFELCSLSLKTSLKCASIVFQRTPSLEGRINLTDELIRTFLPSPQKGGKTHEHVKEWDGIISQIRKLLPERNAVAHAPVGAALTMNLEVRKGAGTVSGVKTWLQTFKRPYELARGTVRQQHIKIEDLQRHALAVENLIKRISAFRETVFPKPP